MRKLLVLILIGLVIYLIASKCKETFVNQSNKKEVIQLSEEDLNDIKNVLKDLIDREYLKAQTIITPQINKQIVNLFDEKKNLNDSGTQFNNAVNNILMNTTIMEEDSTFNIGLYNDFLEDELFNRDLEYTLIRKLSISKIVDNLDLTQFNSKNQKRMNGQKPVGLIDVLVKNYDFKKGEFNIELNKINMLLNATNLFV